MDRETRSFLEAYARSKLWKWIYLMPDQFGNMVTKMTDLQLATYVRMQKFIEKGKYQLPRDSTER